VIKMQQGQKRILFIQARDSKGSFGKELKRLEQCILHADEQSLDNKKSDYKITRYNLSKVKNPQDELEEPDNYLCNVTNSTKMAEFLEQFDVLVIGGSSSFPVHNPKEWGVDKENSIDLAGALIRAWVKSGKPGWATCLGHQLVAQAYRGKKETAVELFQKDKMNIGMERLECTAIGKKDPVFKYWPNSAAVVKGHKKHVPAVPNGFQVVLKSVDHPSRVTVDVMKCGKFYSGIPHPDYNDNDLIRMFKRDSNGTIETKGYCIGQTFMHPELSSEYGTHVFSNFWNLIVCERDPKKIYTHPRVARLLPKDAKAAGDLVYRSSMATYPPFANEKVVRQKLAKPGRDAMVNFF